MRTTRRPRKLGALAAALALALPAGGCAARSNVTYHDPNMDFSLVQTIAVLPFENLSGNPRAGDAVRDVFMTMLQAAGSMYVLPPGEVGRGIERLSLGAATEPSSEQVVQLANILGADVVIVGTVLEYGEVRSGSNSSGVVSVGAKMLEGQTGRVVWSAGSSAGGVSAAARVFGGGGKPMDNVTRKAVDKLLDRLFL